jgi:E3 ubiquitin-protein ligase BRE1
MQEYKREKNALETKVNQMSKTTMQLNDHLRIIDAWYNQLIDEIKILIGPSGESQGGCTPDGGYSCSPC